MQHCIAWQCTQALTRQKSASPHRPTHPSGTLLRLVPLVGIHGRDLLEGGLDGFWLEARDRAESGWNVWDAQAMELLFRPCKWERHRTD